MAPLYVNNELSKSHVFSLSGCSFQDNAARISGGAMITGKTRLSVAGTRFWRNYGRNVAALLVASVANATMRDCAFEENVGDNSSAVYFSPNVQVTVSSPLVLRDTVDFRFGGFLARGTRFRVEPRGRQVSPAGNI